MKRTQVFLPEQLIYKLEQLADKKGISKGESIRRALEEYIESKVAQEGQAYAANRPTPPQNRRRKSRT